MDNSHFIVSNLINKLPESKKSSLVKILNNLDSKKQSRVGQDTFSN